MSNCGCGHCGCDDNSNKTPEEKVDDLKEAIKDLGYKVEKTEEGEIRVSE